MKQTLEAGYDAGPLFLNGPNVRFTSVAQLLSQVRPNANGQSFAVGIETHGAFRLQMEYAYSSNEELQIRSMSIARAGKDGRPRIRPTPSDDAAALQDRLSVLADTARRGVRLIVETHSALLLLSVRTLIANAKLDPDLVKLHWFSLSREDGSTAVSSADLDEDGAYGAWPEDFGDIELAAEEMYLDAVGQRNGI